MQSEYNIWRERHDTYANQRRNIPQSRPIAEDEGLMKRAAKYLKKLATQKEDDTLMTKEEFFARIDESLQQAKEGKVKTFTDIEEMNAWLDSL